jgi:hypothetical protein
VAGSPYSEFLTVHYISPSTYFQAWESENERSHNR